MHVIAKQDFVGGHAADAEVLRHRARRAQLRFGTPDMEVLQRSLREILSLRDRGGLRVALDDDGPDSAPAELDRKAKSDRTAAHDNDGCDLVERSGHAAI